ncbi:MAG TPA: DUF1559 domain-containing protein, partial [Gemmataceae bacterium]|nr:DUF1559 domain-containing protein [Gemmataceae bacterium]
MSDDRDYDRRPETDDEYDLPPGTGRSNGLATAALVCGILSMCLGALTGIPAIVLGALGMSRAKQTGTGQGLAIAGLVLGIVGLVVPTFIMIALLLPAVQKVREAAGRAKDANNMKMIALSIHNYNDANNGRLPGPYANGPIGKPNPGLSWRVAVLPYLEEDSLHKRFNLGQAWDSPANRSVSQTVVPWYLSTSDPPDNQTRFRAFVGPGTAFENEHLGLPRDFPDGTSNTLLFVETADKVPWASPQDLAYQPGGPLPPLGHPGRPTFLVAMADGSVVSLRKSINPAVLHAIIS